ncbi:neuropeptide-like protein 32 [Lutzomyia longipalpis]|uniref:Putative neuropeptide-like protein 32 cyphomyrmex costatus n=1 Tax=Lutzomyia longipalpis TaxID=7200 RepID=A0A7G3AR04_LUTLO|nr:neuropeptide-like protein 32 [Lutzomyia longipalpis]
MIKFIAILALIAVCAHAYPAEEPAANVEIHPREVAPEQSDVAVAPEGEEEGKEGLNPSESAWGWGGYGGWRGGWGGGWGGYGGWGGGYGWGGRGYGGWRRGWGWGYPRHYYRSWYW